MMNEIIKALFHAQVSQNVVFFRVGTSGGVGRTRLSSSFILFLHIIQVHVSLLFNVTKSFLLSLIAMLRSGFIRLFIYCVNITKIYCAEIIMYENTVITLTAYLLDDVTPQAVLSSFCNIFEID